MVEELVKNDSKHKSNALNKQRKKLFQCAWITRFIYNQDLKK